MAENNNRPLPPLAEHSSASEDGQNYIPHQFRNYFLRGIAESFNGGSGSRQNPPNPSMTEINNPPPLAAELAVNGGRHYRFHDAPENSNGGFRLNPNSIEAQVRMLNFSSTAQPVIGGSVFPGAMDSGYQLPRFPDGESLLNWRIQSAASSIQDGFRMQYRNSTSGGGLNFDAFSVNGNLNSADYYGSSSGRNIWGNSIGAVAANGDNYSPNGFTSPDPRYYGYPANLVHQSRDLESNPLPIFASLDELSGSIYLAAKHPHGWVSVYQKLEEGNPQDIEIIFDELKDHVNELMLHPFGYLPIQKLFEVCCEEQMVEFLLRLLGSDLGFISICTHATGNRVVQKLLENLKSPRQRTVMIKFFSRNVIALTNNVNGNHVIMNFLRDSPAEDCRIFTIAVAKNYFDISTDQTGCCVIQKIIECVDSESQQLLLSVIIPNAISLSEDQYGNYVVQHVLGLRMPAVTSAIVSVFTGRFVSLSINKYASNVIQKCLQNTEPHLTTQILKELMSGEQFLSVIQHPFGNYVVQTALQECKGRTREVLMKYVNEHYAFLHSHPYGKRVLEKARECRRRL